jgi:hypothetical protein
MFPRTRCSNMRTLLDVRMDVAAGKRCVVAHCCRICLHCISSSWTLSRHERQRGRMNICCLLNRRAFAVVRVSISKHFEVIFINSTFIKNSQHLNHIMRTFTTFFTLLLTLLFTTSVLATPILEVSIPPSPSATKPPNINVYPNTKGSSKLQQRHRNHILGF